eukprot:TRINITY_DN5405_c0_g1_i3.p3 TRINITY_DN5405_c0_g1~~TRINITY_DN5405_c0_g1_i3.p3  ORF type:complete len:214 (+),score=-20.78 TRINITY_DN5405_c0_g1_i3:1153-1794(+)
MNLTTSQKIFDTIYIYAKFIYLISTKKSINTYMQHQKSYIHNVLPTNIPDYYKRLLLRGENTHSLTRVYLLANSQKPPTTQYTTQKLPRLLRQPLSTFAEQNNFLTQKSYSYILIVLCYLQQYGLLPVCNSQKFMQLLKTWYTVICKETGILRAIPKPKTKKTLLFWTYQAISLPKKDTIHNYSDIRCKVFLPPRQRLTSLPIYFIYTMFLYQ